MPHENQVVIIYLSEPLKITTARFIGGLFCVSEHESYMFCDLVAWGDLTLHFNL